MPVFERTRDGRAYFQCGTEGKEYFVDDLGEDRARQSAINQCLAMGDDIEVIEQEIQTKPMNRGLMIAFWLNEETAHALALEGGEPPDALHLTLTFHGNAEHLAPSAIEKIKQTVGTFAQTQPPIKGILSGIGRFNASKTSGNKDVVYASFDGPMLPQFRQDLVGMLEAIGCPPYMNHGYTPHVSLIYVGQDEPTPIHRIDNYECVFDEIVVTIGDEHYPYLLQGEEGEGTMTKGQKVTKAVQKFLDLPLAPRGRNWDSDGAEQRVRRFATNADGEIDFNQYSRAFLWWDNEKADEVTGYKLQYADIINGQLQAIPRGLFAVAAVLQGSRGGTDIPQADQNRIKTIVARYYEKMRGAFEDDSITPPWETQKTKKSAVEKEYRTDFIHKNSDERLVYGIVLEPNTIDFQDDFVSEHEIEQAAHNFMLKSQTIGQGHKAQAQAKVVQSFIAPTDFEIGGQAVKKGSWVMVTKIFDDALWQGVLNGDFTGYSIGGTGNRTPII